MLGHVVETQQKSLCKRKRCGFSGFFQSVPDLSQPNVTTPRMFLPASMSAHPSLTRSEGYRRSVGGRVARNFVTLVTPYSKNSPFL